MANFRTFLGPSYRSASPVVDAEVCMNFYPEYPESPSARTPVALYPTPGYAVRGQSSAGPCRQLFAQEGRCFGVFGHRVQEVFSTYLMLERGTVAYDSVPATMCSSGDAGNELFITSGRNGYILDLNTNVITQYLTAQADFGAYLDGFFLYLDAQTSTMGISGLRDGTTWDPAKIAQRTAAPDRWISMLVANKLIWLFGSQTSEVWYNAGLSPVPFALVDGAVLQQGILAPASAVAIGNIPTWLGQTKDGPAMVYQAAEGFTARRISNHAVEHSLQECLRQGIDISTAIAWSYQEDGHLFYILSIEDADLTWVYDQATQQWHERGYWNMTTASYEALRARFHCYAFGRHLVGDRSSGNVYEQSLRYSWEIPGNGNEVIRRVRRSPHLFQSNDWFFYSRFELMLETGLGISGEDLGFNVSQGLDPKVILRMSRDGSRTWWEAPSYSSAGKVGEYTKRLQWNRLGKARDAVFEVVVSDPVPFRLAGAEIDFEKGSN